MKIDGIGRFKEKCESKRKYRIIISKSQKEKSISVILASALIFCIAVAFTKIMYPNRSLLYLICNLIQSIGILVQNHWKVCIVIMLILVIKFVRTLVVRRSDDQKSSLYKEQIEGERSKVRSRISNTKNGILQAEKEFQIFKEIDSTKYENNINKNKETLRQIEERFNFEPVDIEKLQKMSFDLRLIDNFISEIHTQYIDYKKSMNEEGNNNTAGMFFAGCNDKDSITKRYRELMKTFHPDNQNGDQGMTQNIQNAYEKMITNMK